MKAKIQFYHKVSPVSSVSAVSPAVSGLSILPVLGFIYVYGVNREPKSKQVLKKNTRAPKLTYVKQRE